MSKKKLSEIFKIRFGKVSIILVAVFAVLLTIDLVLKHCEEKYFWEFTVIPNFIAVQHGVHNTGAAFSFLSDTEWGRIFFIVLTFIMLVVMTCVFLFLPERFKGLKISLVMIASGALGNLVDRLAFGYVRDFVYLNIFGTMACCNFADFWIVLGVILAVVDMLFLNEWAMFPLTKTAKQAAKAREQKEDEENEEKTAVKELDVEPVQTEETPDKSQENEDGGEE